MNWIFDFFVIWSVGFFLTFFVFFTEWPEKVTQTSISRKVNLLRENPCRFESTNEQATLSEGFGRLSYVSQGRIEAMKLKFLEFQVKFCSFCRGAEFQDLTMRIHFWPLQEIFCAVKSIWALIMIFMYLTTYRKGPEDSICSFDRSPALILS